jgi:hypothetical protein
MNEHIHEHRTNAFKQQVYDMIYNHFAILPDEVSRAPTRKIQVT